MKSFPQSPTPPLPCLILGASQGHPAPPSGSLEFFVPPTTLHSASEENIPSSVVSFLSGELSRRKLSREQSCGKAVDPFTGVSLTHHAGVTGLTAKGRGQAASAHVHP